MAQSGYIQGTYTGSLGGINGYVQLSWWATSKNIADNSSSISWELKLHWESRVGGGASAINNGSWNVTINDIVFTESFGLPALTANSDITIASGTAIIPHNADGSKSFPYSFSLYFPSIAGAGLNPRTVVGNGTGTLERIAQNPYFTQAPDFNDEENPTMRFANHSDGAIQVCLSANDGGNILIPWRVVNYTMPYYTFDFTIEEREILRKFVSSGDSATIYYGLYGTVNGADYHTFAPATLTIVNGAPTVLINVTDTNSAALELTGSAQTFVKGVSNAKASVTAVGNKRAKITSISLENSGQYSGLYEQLATEIIHEPIIEAIDNPTFYYSATDSRGFETSANYTIPAARWIDYFAPTVEVSKTYLATSGQLTFAAKGAYFNNTFGAQDNSLEVSYILKKNGREIEEKVFTESSSALSAASLGYTFDYTINGLAVDDGGAYNTYSLIVTVKDKLNTIVSDESYVTATPIFDWGYDSFNFNVPVHFSRGFTDDVGLKMATLVRTLPITAGAGAYTCGTLSEMGISQYEHSIYSITGTISSGSRIYPIPALPIGNSTGTQVINDAVKFWIEGDIIYITVADSWGNAPVKLVIMYF